MARARDAAELMSRAERAARDAGVEGPISDAPATMRGEALAATLDALRASAPSSRVRVRERQPTPDPR